MLIGTIKMGSEGTKPEGLSQGRKRINAVDDQIIELLLKRIELANTVMNLKAPFEVVDRDREQEVLKRYSEKLSSLSTPEKLKRLVAGIIAASRIYPEE